MTISVDVRDSTPAADLLAVTLSEPPDGTPGLAAGLEERVRSLAAQGEASAAPGAATIVHLDEGAPSPRLALAGVGPRARVDADALRTAAAAVARAAAPFAEHVAWLVDPSLEVDAGEQARAVVEGVVLGVYDPGHWKTSETPSRLRRLTLVGDRAALAPAAERAARVAAWVNRARDLVNAPPNELTPERLAERAREIAAEQEHVRVEAFGPEGIRGMGMGAFAAVAQASHNPPRLVVMRYDPPEPRLSDVTLGLVGKAITFDTGGISIKPALYMEDMKGDMAGGAAVVEGLGALAEVGVPLRAIAVVAATENMVGGGAYRPGDILRAMNGKTIEVVNTDAEGRLILADALAYARQEGATHILDLATLTGAMELALGDLYAGVFGEDDEWRDLVVEAGNAAGDHAWPWPLHPRYRRYVDSSFADMKNASILRQGSPVLAAAFLREFTGEGSWAHVDMAGPGFLRRSRGDYFTRPGGTGYGVRMIVELAERLAQA